ncbi:MAG: hypothetical protein QM730_03960 [Anaerolineales bacterium]
MAFLLFSKSNFEKRIRNVLWWFISALSLPWLFYVWRSMSETPNDIRVVGWSLLISAPIWFMWLVLVNRGEKYTKISRLLLLACVLPIYAYAISDSTHVLTGLFATREMELFVYTSMFGMFLILGMWVRDYQIVLFRD